ncbi:hypothetical protein M2368_000242 [Arthrobacter sp. JUb119]|nr:hypothetical protein [Arthrobacter sp. JUb119]
MVGARASAEEAGWPLSLGELIRLADALSAAYCDPRSGDAQEVCLYRTTVEFRINV